ncbi:hypothetical protein [Mycoplana rhizolycopersici]|uniref:Uncharacterized protein n=1 Tax=Mycoplana rhizolycopersici TaxID=2746702 RepID=A0ABX2QHH1_9HYPH|nr:hypothetical protein [Rhizobium rhizolycopersici]NVP56058.1 hypothetical protein [Rhizobium rhizolycopersici]
MSPLEGKACSKQDDIRALRVVDDGKSRQPWIFLSRDVFAWVLLDRWLVRCSQTKWEDSDAFSRMQKRMESVQDVLANGIAAHVDALCLLTKSDITEAAVFSVPAVAETNGLDARIIDLVGAFAAQSALVEKYCEDMSDAMLVLAATMHVTARQYVLARRALQTPWQNKASEEEARKFIKLAFEQLSRRSALAEGLRKSLTANGVLQGDNRQRRLAIYVPMSDIDEIHKPETDIFEAVSAAYDALVEKGELGDPEMPDLDRSEGLIPWDDSWDTPIEPGEIPDQDYDPEKPFGDPRDYPDPDEDFEPLPRKDHRI